MEKITEILAINETGTEAEIYINGIIGYPADWQHDDPEGIVTTSRDLKAELKALDKINKDVKKITLFIDSPGGSVSHALAMFNILDNHKAEKYVVYTGNSASAATVIAAVAPKENITLPEYLAILVHEARAENYGTAKSMIDLAKDLEKANKSIAIIYSNLNGLTVEENLAIMGENNGEGMLLTAQEAFDLGFIGNISKINGKIAALSTSNLGWSNYHIDKLNKFYSQINIDKMGLTDLLKSKSIQNVEPEKQNEPVNIGFSGELVLEEKTIKIENGLIMEIVDNVVVPAPEDKAPENTNPEVENLKKQIAELQALNSDLQKTVNDAKLTVANPKIPVSEFKDEEAKQTVKNSRQYIYELQNKIREEKLNKLKSE